MVSQETLQFTDNLAIRFEGENAIDINQLMGYLNGVNKAYRALVVYNGPHVKTSNEDLMVNSRS